MTHEPHVLRDSFARVEHVADKLALSFYSRLFVDNPELRDLFPVMMDVQRSRLLRALVQVLQGLDSPVLLDRYLGQLGHDHRKFAVRPEHYGAVGRALIAALKEYSRGHWTPEIEAAWTAAYGAVAERMIAGAAADADRPPFWAATVVHHERATSDIALLALRPHQPYPYRPGQYLSLSTQRRARLWRTYSIANAPRPDNILQLQIRAVPGGSVSNALVCHTAVGDIVHIGPSMGDLGVDADSDRGLVFVAGGTGLAPCKAMIEDLASWNSDRETFLFYGTRQIDDLYGLSTLRRLADQMPWLTVIGAVSDDNGYIGRRGRICDVAADHRPWKDHTVYVSGPPAMIRTTVQCFRERGVPNAEIRFDPHGEG